MDLLNNKELKVKHIIGQSDKSGEKTLYLTKFAEKSYLDAKWLSKNEIICYREGDDAFENYLEKIKKNQLIHSFSIPSLLLVDDQDMDSNWLQPKKIIHKILKGNETFYCVLWGDLDYENVTLEKQSTFKNDVLIEEYNRHMIHYNYKKIPTRWKRPDVSEFKPMTEKPMSKGDEVIEDFQLEGLNWLIKCWFEHKNSCLADLTRLGKATEVILTLQFLKDNYNVHGPFLLLTSQNKISYWYEQFENWSNLNVVVYNGSALSKNMITEYEFYVNDESGNLMNETIRADVIIMSQETYLLSVTSFIDIDWRYVVIDEGKKINNHRSRLRKTIMGSQISFEHLTLLTESDIYEKSNSTKMFYTLNILAPQKFNNLSSFAEMYDMDNEEKMNIINDYFLFRDADKIIKCIQGKNEKIVLCSPSSKQRNLYKEAIKRNTEMFLKPITDETDEPLLFLIYYLRNLCNHPFLVQNIQEINENSLIEMSGKLYFLDLFLQQLLLENNKILIYSQLVSVLDVLVQYLNRKNIKFVKIDSTTLPDERKTIIKQFQDKNINIMLFSSKLNGYKIDAQLFDKIIIYDNDYYTFSTKTKADIYRLVLEGTYETELVGPNNMQACFDVGILDFDEDSNLHTIDAEDVELMLRNTASSIFDSSNNEHYDSFFNLTLDQILKSNIRECVAKNEAVLNFNQQKEYWKNVLNPIQTPNISPSPGFSEPKQLIQSFFDHGYRGNIEQLDFLKCTMTLVPPKDKKTINLLNSLVGDNSSEEPFKKFGNFSWIIDKYAEKIYSSVTFFANLHKVLFLTTKEGLIWPNLNPTWGNPYCEYSLLYLLDKYGFKNWQLFIEKEEALKDVEPLTHRQIEKRVNGLINEIELQFSNINDWDFNFEPMPPSKWKSHFQNFIQKDLLTKEELSKIIIMSQNYGFPFIGKHPNIELIRKFSEIKNGISNEFLAEYIEKIISVLLTTINGSSPKYEIFPQLKIIKDMLDNELCKKLLFITRYMDKVHRFTAKYDILNETSFNNLKLKDLPSWWTFEHSRSLIYSISKYGILNTDKWINDKDIIFKDKSIFEFLDSERKILYLSSLIIDQVKFISEMNDLSVSPESNNTKISDYLNIQCYGEIIYHQSFKNNASYYPVGFVCEILPNNFIKEIPDIWFKCEIQAIGNNPIFLVKKLDCNENDKEYIDFSPIVAWNKALSGEFGDQAVKSLLDSKVTGDFMFGLTNVRVTETIQKMLDKKETLNQT